MNELKQVPHLALDLETVLNQVPAPDLQGIDVGETSEWRYLIARGRVKQNELLVQVKDLPKILEKSYTRQFEALMQRNSELYKELQAAQAKIDALMLEYCPDEMSPDQLKAWEESQVETSSRQSSD